MNKQIIGYRKMHLNGQKLFFSLFCFGDFDSLNLNRNYLNEKLRQKKLVKEIKKNGKD